ncbi:MAG TPA: tetratricopeptide repeat protein [Pyrinomonadaceae bacterium]
MRAKKITSVVFACALSLNGAASLARADAYAPVAAAPFARPATEAPARAAAPAPDAPAASSPDQSGDDAPQKKRGNPFIRVLTAPFRAIGRFFSGEGGAPKDEIAKAKVGAKPAPAADAATVVTRPAAEPARAQAAAPDAAAATDPTYVPAPSLLAAVPANATGPAPETPEAQPQTVSMTQPSSALAATASAAPSISPAKPTPKSPLSAVAPPAAAAPFTPLIVGVPGDALSQGRALLERGYHAEAIRELSIAAVSGTNLVEANNLLGLAYDRLGRHAQARGYYERALAAAPDDARVVNNLGYSFYLDDRYKDALAKLKEAARLAPENPEIYNNLGFVYARLNRYDDALRNFARAGGDFYARVQTGALLEVGGRDLEAVKHYEAARRIDPARADVLRRLISLYTRTGQSAKAEAAERALARP